jgi:pimeloyl-ACP methyl ester carboxylesterase
MPLRERTRRRLGPLVTRGRARLGGLAVLVVAGLIFVSASGFVGVGSNASAAVPRSEPTEGTALFDSSFTHGRVRIDDGFLHYVKGGSGPVLVLIHGWPETWWEWHSVMPALAKNHTVIAFDLPGLGDSSIPKDGYDSKTTAARLHQAVNRLGYRQVQVMGHDQGVLIGYSWTRDYPNEVTRLAVIDSTLIGFGLEEAYPLSFHFGFNMAPAPIPEEILDDDDVSVYLNYVFRFAAVPGAIDIQHYVDAYKNPKRRSAGFDYYRAWPANAVDNQQNAQAKRLRQPVLAMGAEFVFGMGVAGSFQQVADDVRGVGAPGAGHWPQEETPQFVIDCANLFFGPAGVAAPSPALANCAA